MLYILRNVSLREDKTIKKKISNFNSKSGWGNVLRLKYS